jgi:hypothetical protein
VGWGLVVAVCFVAPWLTRALLLFEKRLAVGPFDLRGALADASVALLVIGSAGLLVMTGRRWGRALGVLTLSFFVVASFAMYEFISAFDSLYALSHIGFLGDLTFLGGSARHMRHPALLGSVVAMAVAGGVWARAPSAPWWRWWAVALGASILGQLAIPLFPARDEWRQRHAAQAHVSLLPGSARIGPVAISRDVREVFRGDLRGKRWMGPLADRPNVLLIMVEGASGAYLPSVASAYGVRSATVMPKLDALARRHVFLTRVISHQRQTNRGEYAILCGDYPKLLTDQPKMTEQAYGAARLCLPEVLRKAGYATAYIQAAPLGFMLKDQFMPKAGFEELIGDPWFKRSYARTDWGVDDKAFFEQALGRVLELHASEKPFFATLLTVGTHHPYTLPDAVPGQGELSPHERAFRWADEALAAFLSEIDRRGVLRDTVVIITSDESAGLVQADSAIERLLSQSWSFVLVMLPEPRPRRIDTPYAHVDTALSVLDLLGMERKAKRFAGRSWFREYDRPRRLFAGNTYARRVIMLEPSGAAVVCGEGFDDCVRSVTIDGSVFGSNRLNEPVWAGERQLLAEVARLTRSREADTGDARHIDLLTDRELSIPSSEGKKLLAGGQYLRVPEGTMLRVDFDLEVVGDETAMVLHQDLFLDGYPKLVRQGVRLRGGERWQLSYEIGVPHDSGQLVVQLYATTVSADTSIIRIHDARLSMTAGSARSEQVVVIRDEISPVGPP